jgi:hypothetical protein
LLAFEIEKSGNFDSFIYQQEFIYQQLCARPHRGLTSSKDKGLGDQQQDGGGADAFSIRADELEFG